MRDRFDKLEEIDSVKKLGEEGLLDNEDIG